jgi:Ca-activated chloride channel family protein
MRETVARFSPVLLVLILTVPAAGSAATPATNPAVDPQAWLAEVDLLIAPREREAFLGLAGDAARRDFMERFWQVRDPYPETPRNELAERWASGVPEARRRWGTLADDRARVFLLQGEPNSSFEVRCPGRSEAFELWVYEPRFRVKHRAVLVFLAGRQGPARLWRPGPEAPSFPAADAGCSGGEPLAREARWLRLAGEEHYRALVERALLRPKPSREDWFAGLATLATEIPAGAQTFQAGLEVDYPGQIEERQVVRVMMTVPPGSLRDRPDRAQELLLTGEVLRDRKVLESFRYLFRVQPDAVEGQGIPLAFERLLLPGFYKLKVKIEDLLSKSFFLGERELAVPGPQPTAGALAAAGGGEAVGAVPAVAAPAPAGADFWAEAGASLAAREPGLRVFSPAEDLLIGNVRFEARVDRIPGLAEAEQIDRVAFLLDGRRILTRTRPPFAVTLDLGPVPRAQTLKVEGLNRAGEVLASDELAINAGAQRFSVRLLEPRPNKPYRRSLRARAEVEPPPGQSVERVEFYFNEGLVATLYQPPYAQPVALPGKGAPAGYVRAVAYLADGAAAEDVVLLNAPEQPDAMDVRLVELFTTVLDRGGRPVEGLAGGEFQVAEDGVRQAIRRVDRVTDIPVRVVTLIDNSGSMRGRMEATRQAALGFFRRALRPVDQAAVITFNRAPHVTVGFTNDLARLEGGFTGLVAEDQTSLYDSVAFALHYLTGASGQRAVLLLSDGVDRASRFSFDQALEYARRSGITIYTIGVDLPQGERGEAADKLARLAAETGGRSFFVAGTAELDGVYQQIERELRSQYRITYQSSNTSTEDKFRAVHVELAQSGLEARTISGYYP